MERHHRTATARRARGACDDGRDLPGLRWQNRLVESHNAALQNVRLAVQTPYESAITAVFLWNPGDLEVRIGGRVLRVRELSDQPRDRPRGELRILQRWPWPKEPTRHVERHVAWALLDSKQR